MRELYVRADLPESPVSFEFNGSREKLAAIILEDSWSHSCTSYVFFNSFTNAGYTSWQVWRR